MKSHRDRCGKKPPTGGRRLNCWRQPERSEWRAAWERPSSMSRLQGGVARSGKTAAGIDSLAPARLALAGFPFGKSTRTVPTVCVAQHSRLQKSANALQRSSWDFISAS